jgi:hypothetical protein
MNGAAGIACGGPRTKRPASLGAPRSWRGGHGSVGPLVAAPDLTPRLAGPLFRERGLFRFTPDYQCQVGLPSLRRTRARQPARLERGQGTGTTLNVGTERLARARRRATGWPRDSAAASGVGKVGRRAHLRSCGAQPPVLVSVPGCCGASLMKCCQKSKRPAGRGRRAGFASPAGIEPDQLIYAASVISGCRGSCRSSQRARLFLSAFAAIGRPPSLRLGYLTPRAALSQKQKGP